MSRKNTETRNRILKSTWKLLETEVGADVRMVDIAKEASLSRQAVYLHFPNRADLLIATTRYLDDVHNVDERLAASRSAKSGIERLDAYIDAWGNYIPLIYGVAKALLAMKDSDDAALTAWNDRMQAVRAGCEAAIKALQKDGRLSKDYKSKQATDLLWTLLSVRNWEQLTVECGFTQTQYIKAVKSISHRTFVSN